MLYFFAVWLIAIVGGLLFCLFGSMVSSIAGSSTVTFLLITGLIAAAATAIHQLMERLEELKEQFQNQTRQLQNWRNGWNSGRRKTPIKRSC